MNNKLGHKQYFAYLVFVVAYMAASVYFQNWQYAITNLGYMALGWNIGSIIIRIIYWEKFN
jgi:hypothetical protein